MGLLSLSLFLFSSLKSLDDYQINGFLGISHYYPLMIPFYFVGDRDQTFTSYSTCFGLLCFNADSGLLVNLRKIELVAIREVEVVSDLKNLF